MENPIESQNARIKKYLLSGKSLTALDALYAFGTFRLGARIHNLKQQGLDIETTMVEITSPSVFGGVKRVAKYTLKKKI